MLSKQQIHDRPQRKKHQWQQQQQQQQQQPHPHGTPFNHHSLEREKEQRMIMTG